MAYIQTTSQSCSAAPRRSQATGLARILHWIAVARQRRSLRDLDAHLLKDIGVSEKDAYTEARRAFWDAPSHWHML
ncbi:MAG: DUF1127 domain-containing protein [Pseudomonadota bacterium]